MNARFDPTAPIGQGRTVIEASAGTGKTFTIAAMVARLVAAEGLPIDQILVITFTRAATAELRARVRRRLVQVLDAAESGVVDADDLHMVALLEAGDRAEIAERVFDALTNFDRAQIFTIHGFAHRLLGELGFGSRLAAELEPAAVDRKLVGEAAGDLVIGRYAHGAEAGDRVWPGQVGSIGAAVTGVPDARIVPSPGQVAGVARTRAEMALAMRQELQRRLRWANQVTFDDGLAEVRDTLDDPEVGSAARALLAERYAIGLVDEAQDTDPVQWQVINAVFGGARLVVIGDPKQSIYRFRGADINAYLAAAEDAQRRTLGINWRSDRALLQAFDVLFREATFGDEDIGYIPVEAPPEHHVSRISGVAAAMSLRWFGGDIPIDRKRNGDFYVDEARRVAAADAASEVVRLLTAGVSITDDAGHTAPIAPSDIAVLCRTMDQVEMVRRGLGARDVPSVAGRSGAVFLSDAAEQWRRFLFAVEHPERMDLVRLGATSDIVGMTLHQVAKLDDEAELDLQAEMRGYQTRLRTAGVPALMADVDRVHGLTARTLSQPDGERMMTDLTHVAEELHGAWRPGRIGSLVAWLEDAQRQARQRAEAREDEPESRQRRLETDAEAVQVLTIHAAKGLEFPVVMVPFAWDAPVWPPDIPIFHDPAGGGRMIDVGGKGNWPEFDAHQQQHLAEEAAEESRRLYVALTRAKHHVIVWWVKDAPGADASTLGRLMSRAGWREDAQGAESAGLIDKPGRTDLPPVEQYQTSDRDPAGLSIAVFDRPLDHVWTRASFSRLSPEHPLADQPGEAEEVRADEQLPDEDVEVSEGPELPMADLPRGARFGTLVHELLEHIDFTDTDPEASLRVRLGDAMAGGGWDFDTEAFVAGMIAMLTTPLGAADDAPSLTGIGRVLKELVFELPVRTDAGPVSLADIGSVMAEHLAPDDPIRAYARHLDTLGAQRFRGFLTGAIDLTVQMPDGRFVVMDYKSNALSDYGAAGLNTAMIEGNYVLQSTLYQVALHRYLTWRLPGYQAETRLGGSVYIFLRGTSGPDTPVADGVRQGIHVWTPPPAMIVSLSRLFERDDR